MNFGLTANTARNRFFRFLALLQAGAILFMLLDFLPANVSAAGLTLESGSSSGWGKPTGTSATTASVGKPRGAASSTRSSSASSGSSGSAPVEYSPNRLFGTVEFKSKVKNMPKWERVVKAMSGKNDVIAGALTTLGRNKDLAAWNNIKSAAKQGDQMAYIKKVNAFINKWPYRYDMDNYGIPDYWATPLEFFKRAGDCEDYAIAKLFALKDIGFNIDKMRIVVLKDTIRNIDHAVLAVYLGDKVYIMDNMTDQVFDHAKYRHYQPQLSVGWVYRWAHLPAKK